MPLRISCDDRFLTETCVLALTISLGNKTNAEQHPVKAPYNNNNNNNVDG
jgi:hypothetical protein